MGLTLARARVRPYQPEDLDPVVDLWYATWHATFPDLTHHESKGEWRQRFEREIVAEERVFIAEVDRRRPGGLAERAVRLGATTGEPGIESR